MATKITRRIVEVRDSDTWKRYEQSPWGEWFLVGWSVVIDGEPGRWHRINCTSKVARRMFASYELSRPKTWNPPIPKEN